MIAIAQLTDEQFERHALDVLMRELGPDGLARFLRLNRSGTGDYTRGRDQWQRLDARSDSGIHPQASPALRPLAFAPSIPPVFAISVACSSSPCEASVRYRSLPPRQRDRPHPSVLSSVELCSRRSAS